MADSPRAVRIAWAAALAVAAGLFAAHAGRFAGYAQDDAFISFTYARNLVEHGALVYRADERTIGYSNPLWVLMSAPVYAVVGSDRLLASMQLLSTLAGAALAAATGLAARRLGAGRGLAALAALATASVSALAMQAQSGLETLLFALLLLLGFLALAPALTGVRSPHLGIALLLAAAFTRSEGIVYLTMALTALGLARPRDPALRRALLGSAASLAAALGFALLVHGTVVPNTAIAKLGADYPLAVRWTAGLVYAVDAVGAVPVGWLLPLAASALWSARRSPAARFAGLLAVAPWVESVLVGGDAMPGFRFVVPGLPLLAALAAAGGTALARRLQRYVAGALTVTLFALFALGAQWLAPRSTVAAAEVAAAARNARLVAGYVEVAKGMSALCAGGEELATDVAGAFAFFTDCRVLDTWGLASSEIARRGRAYAGKPFVTFGVVAPEVLLERRPAYLLPYPPIPMARPWERERALAALFPAGFYLGRPELSDYARAVLTTPNGRFAFLVRGDLTRR